jgi:hypothetical protein
MRRRQAILNGCSAAFIIGLAVFLLWPIFLADAWTGLTKLLTNPRRVRSYGLPVYPGAMPVPYTRWRDGHHMDSERLGTFRFVTNDPFDRVVNWYRSRLPSPPWKPMHVVSPGLDAQADRPNPDGVTATDIRVNLTDGRTGPTYVFYYVPTASVHYQRDLQHLRDILKRDGEEGREEPPPKASPKRRGAALPG